MPLSRRSVSSLLACGLVAALGCAGTGTPLRIREPRIPAPTAVPGANAPDAVQGARAPDAVPATAPADSEPEPPIDPGAVGAYLRADARLRAGDLEGAAEALAEVVARDPAAVEPRLRLAEILRHLGRIDEAVALIRSAPVEPTALPPRLLATYAALLAEGDTADAEAILAAALQRGLLRPEALLGWFAQRERSAGPGELLESVARFRAAGVTDPVLTCVEGHLRVRQGRYEAARELLERCLEAYPRWLPGLLERALVADLEGDVATARRRYREVLARVPDQPLARWRLRALAAGDAALSRRRFEHLLDEVRYETMLSLIVRALQAQDPERAARLFAELSPGDRARPRSQLLAGLIAQLRGRTREALAAYAEALTADEPTIRREAALRWTELLSRVEPERWRDRAEALLRERDDPALALAIGLVLADGDLETGITYLEQAAQRFGDRDPEIWYRLGGLYERAGRRADALRCMEEVLARDPEHADALNFLGYSLAEEGRDLERAERLIRRALEHKPEAGYILDSMGWVLYQQGRYEEAVPYLERALEREGEDPVILEHLGDAYVKVGAAAKAMDTYRRVLEITDDPEQERRVSEKLERLP